MGHNHSHNHAHGHHHHHDGTGNIAVAFLLNLSFSVIELIGGILTNSVAILSDALHDLGDSLSLGTAWYFQKKSTRNPTGTYTYGYKRFSLVGAFINSIVLITGSIFIITESVQRLKTPEQPDAKGMLFLAILGIAVNLVAMLRLRRGRSINEKVVSLHLLEDVLGWIAVLVGSIVMMFVDLPIIDPILSLMIACFVLVNVYRNIRPAISIMLQSVPDNISEEDVRKVIFSDPKVKDVHDFRLWTMDGLHHVLSLHVVVTENMDLKTAERLKESLKAKLKDLHITHATIEIEFEPEH